MDHVTRHRLGSSNLDSATPRNPHRLTLLCPSALETTALELEAAERLSDLSLRSLEPKNGYEAWDG